MMVCCGKVICKGCDYANQRREVLGRLQHNCVFCRKAVPKTEEEITELLKHRIEVNDPTAMFQMGTTKYEEGDYKAAFEYLTKAAALGDVEAHHHLSNWYSLGKGVEKDEKKERHHSADAAIGGHPVARYNFGCLERKYGRVDKVRKHWIIAAKLGYDLALAGVKDLYKAGLMSKDDFAAALRGHHAAVDATKSHQREEAAEIGF